jgi:hypothetical protein
MLCINRRGKMKKICFVLFTFMMVVLLGACGSVGKIEGDTATAKTSAKTSEKTSDEKQQAPKKEKKEDIWTYYNNATWSDNYKGLKTEVEKVVVSDKAPGLDDDGNEITTSAVGVKLKVENTTNTRIF